MKNIKLRLKERSYNIVVGYDMLDLLGKYIHQLRLGNSAYIITNPLIKKQYGNLLNRALNKDGFDTRFKLTADNEKSKSIETAAKVIKDIAAYDKKRQIFIVAFGGGVIGDLAGFVASIYKRGVPYLQFPTTLLAQVDSSIGGKTALDLREGKNLVGAFYQPKMVFSDVKILRTLSPRQVRSGLAEVIKYGIIKDPQLFAYLEKRYKNILALKRAELEFIVTRSSQIKATIVQKDEREERGTRTILNFGHTLGHAIETAGNYRGYNHGEAIALGMLVASRLSQKLGLINNKTVQRIEKLIKKVGLCTKITKASLNEIIEAHYYDKKFIGPRNRFVLTRGLGKTKIVENIPLEVIEEALKERISG